MSERESGFWCLISKKRDFELIFRPSNRPQHHDDNDQVGSAEWINYIPAMTPTRLMSA